MTSHRIVSISLTLRKSLVAYLAATLLAAPAIAQTSADEVRRLLNESNASLQQANAAIAEAQRKSEGSPANTDSEATPASPQPASADPAAWGVLATLAGNRWQTADGVVRAFEWSSDGRELVESELVGGLPTPTNIYSMQGNELVQHECLPSHSPCIRLVQRFGTVQDDGAVVFKAISALGKKSNPSVALRERPVADWGKWKRKYLFIGETLISFKLVGTDQLEVTKSFSSKMTSDPVEAPWGEPQVQPTTAYSRVGVVVARADHVATADFGAMEIFAGKRMISEDLGEILELQHQPDGSLVIQWFSLSGQAIGRYVFAAGAGGGSELELRDYPYVNSQSLKMRIKAAGWRQGGILFFITQPEGSGHMMTHEFSLTGGKIRTVRFDTDIGSTLTGKPKVESFSSGTRSFIPATPELIAEAVAANEHRLQEEKRQAQLAAKQRREREAQAERNFASFMGGLTTFANTYNESMAESRAEQAQQQAFLDGLRHQAEEAERGRMAHQQAAADADARRNAEVVRQANQRQDQEASRLAEQRRHYEQQRAATAQASSLPSGVGKIADAGHASTDTDANRCVSQSEVRENDTFKGNTAAYVVNGCGTPVDVRICLMTGSGWKCGATLGLAPQAKWSHSAFHATGAVFVDARTAGSNRRFASPN